jgi:hypothetical protein
MGRFKKKVDALFFYVRILTLRFAIDFPLIA